MNNADLDSRIHECAAQLGSVIHELREQDPTIEQAVALGVLLACWSALEALTGQAQMEATLESLVADGLLEVVKDEPT